jgi:hypothetical protein
MAFTNWSEMRYKVTGGSEGTAGIEVADKRYEPGDEVEMTPAKAQWLVEQGYLEPADSTKSGKKVVEEEPAPATEDGEVF